MRWTKLGRLFVPNTKDSFRLSHAANPLPVHIDGDVFRVFYNPRDEMNKSSVSWVDINILSQEVLAQAPEATITYGNDGSFYSHGISIGNMYQTPEGKQYILFMGWQIENGEHWRGDIGRLELTDSKTLTLNPSTVFIGIDSEDPISLSYPFVLFDKGVYKMWYGSTIDWTSANGEMIHVIKYASSEDGENWQRHGLAIPYVLGQAQAFSRPTVQVDEAGYHMWFSYRDGTGAKYRIGYAHSIDGVHWTNKIEEVGIEPSSKGWDSEMICYPFVFDHKSEKYMLYNGNGHGKTGFGLAKLA